MIHFIYAKDLHKHPKLAAGMFRDRAQQFSQRLKWAVRVDENGWERDEYDDLNPLYVIYELPDGSHGGSMRLMPTTGQNMTRDHFLDLTDGVAIESPLTWECTRFASSPRAAADPRGAARISAALMLAGCELGLKAGIDFFIGVFDARMRRIYRTIGWSPDIVGEGLDGENIIYAGLWEVSRDAMARVDKRAYPAGRPTSPAPINPPSAQELLLCAA
jgi:acyl homoserine lactone synthase